MAKRTMGVSRLWYHPRRKPDELGNVVELPDGADLLDVFETLARQELKPDTLIRREAESYVTLQRSVRRGRALLLEFESGRFGEDGKIRDVRTQAEVGKFARDNATTVITHGVLLVPKTGTAALAFSERSGGTGGMPGLLEHFVETFNARYREHLMKRQAVVKTAAWLEAAQLMKVQGTVRKYRTDEASDGGEHVVGDLTHTFAPPRGLKYLPRSVWQGLRDRRINRAKFLGFDASTELDEVEVTVSDGTQAKTFEIGNEKTPSLNLVLTTSGQQAPTATKVLAAALDEAREIFEYYGIEWSEADATKGVTKASTST